MTEDTNVWISFSQLDEPPVASGMCLLVPGYVDDVVGLSRASRNGHDIGPIVGSAQFRKPYSAGVLLVSDQDDLASRTDISDDLFEDVDLAVKLSWAINDLLSCVDTGMYRIRSSGVVTQVEAGPTLTESTVGTDAETRLDFAFVVGHSDAEVGTIGGIAAADLAVILADLGVEEAVVLACSGGCLKIGGHLSKGRIAVACGTPVDVRSAYIFGINYLWKRFGDGASPAQSLGASNVVLPNDPYQLWHDGHCM